MRILFDITEPSHALFFLRPIRALKARGHDVLVCSRQRQGVGELLDRLAIDHEPLSSRSGSRAGAAMELFLRDAAMVSVARAFRPHAMIGFGSVAVAHAGAALGIPSIAFQDSEAASLQSRLIHPAITRLFVPEGYAGEVPTRKTTRVPGVRALSHLHPDGFMAERMVAMAQGLDPARRNVFIRMDGWRERHDRAGPGWSLQELCAVIDRFRTEARVHVSSDRPLPATLEQYALASSSDEVQHLLAHCALYVGDDPLQASEAAVLGVRSVYTGRDSFGYLGDLSHARLVSCAAIEKGLDLMGLVEQQVSRSDADVKSDRAAYLSGKPDWSKVVLDSLAPYAPVQRSLRKTGFRQAG